MNTSRFGVAFKGGRLQRRRGERGQILVLFEITLIIVLVFAALVIDLGFLRNDRQTLVNAVDAGALAGGTMLPVTTPAEADTTNKLIKLTVEKTFPGLREGIDYTIEYKCLVPADATGKASMAYIPSSCDPRTSLLSSNPLGDPGLIQHDFVGAGPHRYSSCDPTVISSIGTSDKCNVVVVTASKTTKFNIGPVIGVDHGSTGSISSAACIGQACGEIGPPQPVDLVIILDRTMSMQGNDAYGNNKIQMLQTAAKTVLGIYDPAIQRVGLVLTGPGKVNTDGSTVLSSCGSVGNAYGVADDKNFAPNTAVNVTGSTLLGPQTSFLATTLGAAITSTTATTITPTSKANFPTTYPFTIQIDNEQMSVTASPNGTQWTVTRGFNSTTKATHTNGTVLGWAVSKTDTKILVNSSAGFPTSGNYAITVDSEQMLVTAGQGTNTWTVTRGYNSTTTALHGGNEPVNTTINNSGTTIVVGSKSGFPTTYPFTIKVDSEYMRVTASPSGSTWTVVRGADGSTAANHNTGATITRVVGQYDTTFDVDARHGPAFPSTLPFTIAVANDTTSTYDSEHMSVTAINGSTWTVTRATDGTVRSSHSDGKAVNGVAPWVPDAGNANAWVAVGMSGTDTDSPSPSFTGVDGTYSIKGVVQTGTPIVKAINCISAATAGTNLATPIQMAKWWLDQYGRDGVPQGIILETDGHPQYGFATGDQTNSNYAYTCQAVIDAATAAKADTTHSEDGIKIYTIGYGVDNNTKCPTRTTNWQADNGSNSVYESTTWSGKLASSMLAAAATKPEKPYFWDNPSSSELAAAFSLAATELTKGSSRLIQLYPRPIVEGVSGSSGSITITGEYFTGATTAFVGNQPCGISSVSDTSIHCSASGTGGPYPVTVTTPGGTSFITAVSYFTYP